jgi:hypothetical protein
MQATLKSAYRLKKPCANCPFRKEGAIDLQPGRVPGIIEHLLSDDMNGFPCHKTTYGEGSDEDDDGNYIPNGKEAQCVGAMAFLRKVGRPNVGMRLAMAFGIVDPAKLDALADLIIDPINNKEPK